MRSGFDPMNDPVLLNLKKIALKGGEYGPLCDQGVLAVIGQIEREGHFTRDPTVGLLLLFSMQQKNNLPMLTEEETTEAKEFLAQRGWTLEQGLEYLRGVDIVERMLFRFRNREDAGK